MKKFATAKRQIELLVRDPLLLFLVGAIFLSLAIFVVYPLADGIVEELPERTREA